MPLLTCTLRVPTIYVSLIMVNPVRPGGYFAGPHGRHQGRDERVGQIPPGNSTGTGFNRWPINSTAFVRITGKVVLVGHVRGAIGVGVGKLDLGKRWPNLPRICKRVRAVGQATLMQLLPGEPNSLRCSHTRMILLTASDFENRARYLNARNTINTLFEYGALPIINENDTVSVAEIKFGDNDHLAAMVTNFLRAPLLVLLTNVDGLYSNDPRVDPAAKLLATVPNIDQSVTKLAAETKSTLGTGGYGKQIEGRASGDCGWRSGDHGERLARTAFLDRVFAGEPVGTLFLPHGQDVSSWKRWFGFTVRPKGVYRLDAGAAAGRSGWESLLPIGVTAVEGEFGKGDVISLCDLEGTEIARGLDQLFFRRRATHSRPPY